MKWSEVQCEVKWGAVARSLVDCCVWTEIVSTNERGNSLCRFFLRRNSTNLRRNQKITVTKVAATASSDTTFRWCWGLALQGAASQYHGLEVWTLGWVPGTYLRSSTPNHNNSIFGYVPGYVPHRPHTLRHWPLVRVDRCWWLVDRSDSVWWSIAAWNAWNA